MGHVEYAYYTYVALLENINFKNCNFRVLIGIFGGYSKNKSCLKLKKYQARLNQLKAESS